MSGVLSRGGIWCSPPVWGWSGMSTKLPTALGTNPDTVPRKGVRAGIDKRRGSVRPSCMGKTITIDDAAYKLLAALKRDARDSFTKVILRHVARPADTCGELLDSLEGSPPPNVDLETLHRIEKDRGRRSGGRK